MKNTASIPEILGAYSSMLAQLAIVMILPFWQPTGNKYLTAAAAVFWLICFCSLLGRIIMNWKKDLP